MRASPAGLTICALLACGERAPTSPQPVPARDDAGTIFKFELAEGAPFWATPLPSETRRRADGRVTLEGLATDPRDIVAQMLAILADADGFGLTSTIYLPTSAAIDARALPDPHASTRGDSPVWLVAVDRSSPVYGRRHPVLAAAPEFRGPAARHALALLPYQGLPLEPDTTYAAVAFRTLRDTAGAPVGRPSAIAALVSGQRPAGMSEAAFSAYRDAIAALGEMGVDRAQIAGLTVFRTWRPTVVLERAVRAALARVPTPEDPLRRGEVFDDYCVYAGTIAMPVYQRGTPPYQSEGGDWVPGPDGAPLLQGHERANVVVTVPRARGSGPLPLVVFSRTGGGGERPLVDRGVRDATGRVRVPGSGLARTFAQAGWAGASIDGPHGGLRNVSHMDEQLLIFNVLNPVAMRDNVRQSALELALAAHVLEGVTVDASDCPRSASAPPPASTMVRFDAERLALMGHSMGATIAPLAMAAEPRFKALLLSGAGGSWIENVLFKQKPLAVRGFAEALVGHELGPHDIELMLLQWAGESADPPVYAPAITRGASPRHVLMVQGIVDHYILPAIANATTLSAGLDVGGDALDASTPELAGFDAIERVLDFSGRQRLALPARGNAGGATAIVVQQREDGVEDGHEVVFQTASPKRQIRCFLRALAAAEVPVVVASGAEDAPCE